MKLTVEYEHNWLYGGEPEDDGPWAHHSDAFYEFKITGVKESWTSPYSDDFEIDGKPPVVYVVTVIYSDGNSFGHTEGYGQIEAVCKTKEEADVIKGRIQHDKYYKSRRGYEPWNGYFARLTDVVIDRMFVEYNEKE